MDLTTAAFVAIPTLLAGALVWTVDATSGPRARNWTAIVCLFWMGGTWLAARAGLFRLWFVTPPPFALLVVGIVLLSCLLAFSEVGRRLATKVPLWLLVGVQGFRLPLELAMHEMSERGVMPRQMSYDGLNFDVVTGTTALVVAVLVKTGLAGRGLVLLWNLLGLALLMNVVIVAILAMPRFAYFGRDHVNEWVADPPYVWLPAVMVLAALAGHLLIFRAVRLEAARPPR